MALNLGTRGVVLILVAALLLLSIGGLVFFRDAILSALASRSMAQRGLLCGKVVLHVPLALPPSPIVMEATRCEVAEGPLAAVELKAPLSIHLDGFQVGSIRCASVEVDLRPRAPREVALNALGDLTRLVGLEHAALDLMFDTAALSSQRAPPLLVTEMLVRRAGKVVISFHDLELTSSEVGLTLASPRAIFEPIALLGEGPLLLKATPTAAVVTFAVAAHLKVKVVLDHIDANRPSAEFSVAADSARPGK
jgi:hypothetical protein